MQSKRKRAKTDRSGLGQGKTTKTRQTEIQTHFHSHHYSTPTTLATTLTTQPTSCASFAIVQSRLRHSPPTISVIHCTLLYTTVQVTAADTRFAPITCHLQPSLFLAIVFVSTVCLHLDLLFLLSFALFSLLSVYSSLSALSLCSVYLSDHHLRLQLHWASAIRNIAWLIFGLHSFIFISHSSFRSSFPVLPFF